MENKKQAAEVDFLQLWGCGTFEISRPSWGTVAVRSFCKTTALARVETTDGSHMFVGNMAKCLKHPNRVGKYGKIMENAWNIQTKPLIYPWFHEAALSWNSFVAGCFQLTCRRCPNLELVARRARPWASTEPWEAKDTLQHSITGWG